MLFLGDQSRVGHVSNYCLKIASAHSNMFSFTVLIMAPRLNQSRVVSRVLSVFAELEGSVNGEPFVVETTTQGNGKRAQGKQLEELFPRL